AVAVEGPQQGVEDRGLAQPVGGDPEDLGCGRVKNDGETDERGSSLGSLPPGGGGERPVAVDPVEGGDDRVDGFGLVDLGFEDRGVVDGLELVPECLVESFVQAPELEEVEQFTDLVAVGPGEADVVEFDVEVDVA